AMKLDLVDSKDWVVMHARRRNIVFAGHVLVGQHVDHTGSGAHCRQVNRLEQSVCDGGITDTDMQRALRLRYIVNIDSSSCHMLVRGIVLLIGCDTTHDTRG